MNNITAIMSADAELASRRYGLLVEGWRSIYGAALDQSHFGTQKQMDEVSAHAYRIAHVFLETELRLIEQETKAYALEAQTVTLHELSVKDAQELSQSVSEHLINASDYLLHEIKIQIERDIAFLKQSLRATYLHVQMASRANGLPLRAALMQYRIGNAAELQFFFHDRRNQRWPSRKFIRAVWRQHLLAVYNETVLLTLADHGIDTAAISHNDAKSPHHGTALSIDSNSELPTYAELKPTVFHPNSEAILGRAA